MYICTDLISEIIEYSSNDSLRILSEASPMFDQVIFRLGIRVLFQGKFSRRICNLTTMIIQADSGRVFFIHDEIGEIYLYQPMYSMHEYMYEMEKMRVNITYDIILGDKYYVDKKRFFVVSKKADIFNITRINKVICRDGSYDLVQINGMIFNINDGAAHVAAIHNNIQYMPDWIDFKSNIIIEHSSEYFGFERFQVLWSCGHWKKQEAAELS